MQAFYDVDKLNKEFGKAGRIAFRSGYLGEPIVVLVEEHGTCEVSLYGAQVISYRPRGQLPVLWSSKKDVKEGKALRGGIPICWPWFGPGTPSQHGFLRTARVNLLSTTHGEHTSEVEFVYESTRETLKVWPHKFRVVVKVELGEMLKISLTTENTGDTEMVITEAFHSYFYVGDLSRAFVSGLDGAEYIDKAAGGALEVQTGEVAFSGEVDRLFPMADEQIFLIDRAIKRTIFIQRENDGESVARSTIVWNPGAEKAAGLSDMEKEDYKKFVCVEVGNAGSSKISIEPGKKHILTMLIGSILAMPKMEVK